MMNTLPSAFVLDWLPRVRAALGQHPAALDLAMGAGRHTVPLTAAGFKTFGVDRDWDRLRLAVNAATERRLRLAVWVADLERFPLPISRFDLVICTNYLQRDLWDSIQAAVRSGGFVVYETFTVSQLKHRTGPRSPDHLLRHGELRDVFRRWHHWTYEERDDTVAAARLVARKPR